VRRLLGPGVQLIANGGVRSRADIVAIRAATGIEDVMIGTAALENASIFVPTGLLPQEQEREPALSLDEVIVRFLRLCIDYGNPVGTSKWVVLQMLLGVSRAKKNHALIQAVSKARSLRAICELWHLESYYDAATWCGDVGNVDGDGGGDEAGEESPQKRRK
jgi:tRNA-dihydrouridine synthase